MCKYLTDSDVTNTHSGEPTGIVVAAHFVGISQTKDITERNAPDMQ